MLLATLRVVILSSMVGIVCHRLLGEQVVHDLEVKVYRMGHMERSVVCWQFGRTA
jgi:UPF0716 family protein affecting phage T7 exclusion